MIGMYVVVVIICYANTQINVLGVFIICRRCTVLSDLKYIVDDIKLYCNKVRYVVGGGIASSSFIIQHGSIANN